MQFQQRLVVVDDEHAGRSAVVAHSAHASPSCLANCRWEGGKKQSLRTVVA